MSTPEMLSEKFERAWVEDPIRFDTLPGVNNTWPANKLVKLYKLVKDESAPLTQQELAEIFKVNRSTISRKAQSVNWDAFEAELGRLCFQTTQEGVLDRVDEAKKDILAKLALKNRRKEIDHLAYLKFMEENILRQVQPITKHTLPPITTRPRKTGTPEIAVLILSDLHVGQEFTKNDTGDLSEYSPKIFRTRADNLRKSLLEIVDLHTRLYKIPELRVFALGDFVQGGNMNGQWGPAYINSGMDVTDQTIEAARVVSDMLSTWSNRFERIKFTGVVGNHGRAGAGKNTDKVSANWDRMTYALIQAYMGTHENVEINYSNSWWAQESVYNTEFLLVHGDHVKGTPSALSHEALRIQGLIQGTKKPFNYMCLGHFHTFSEVETSMGGILVNGSFVGGDVHSMHTLKAKSQPTQTLFGVHPERGKTWQYVLNMDFERG